MMDIDGAGAVDETKKMSFFLIYNPRRRTGAHAGDFIINFLLIQILNFF